MSDSKDALVSADLFIEASRYERAATSQIIDEGMLVISSAKRSVEFGHMSKSGQIDVHWAISLNDKWHLAWAHESHLPFDERQIEGRFAAIVAGRNGQAPGLVFVFKSPLDAFTRKALHATKLLASARADPPEWAVATANGIKWGGRSAGSGMRSCGTGVGNLLEDCSGRFETAATDEPSPITDTLRNVISGVGWVAGGIASGVTWAVKGIASGVVLGASKAYEAFPSSSTDDEETSSSEPSQLEKVTNSAAWRATEEIGGGLIGGITGLVDGMGDGMTEAGRGGTEVVVAATEQYSGSKSAGSLARTSLKTVANVTRATHAMAGGVVVQTAVEQVVDDVNGEGNPTTSDEAAVSR